MPNMSDERREKWRRVFGVGLIVMGLGLVATFFYPWHTTIGPNAALIPSLIRFVTYGGAFIALLGAAGFLGRR